ncbi:antirestriction protein [Salmonella enterica]|nr:antirestriction protein [Salmonella enterica]EIR1990021.1 antirestriction protein [Salmonella enterica]MBA3114254.1 antirestriction protein [Salmonella enterica]
MTTAHPSTRITHSSHAVIATTLSDEERINFWPRYFGNVRQWVFLEPQVFAWLDLWSTDYQGGIWDFHILSDDGAFLTPPECDFYHLVNEDNGNEATLTTEATGIAVCLMVWSRHASRTHCEAMNRHYYRLHDYALTHTEHHGIMRLIDRSI